MAFELRAVQRTKLYSSIVDQIIQGVQSGAFPAGQAMPAERALAAQFGVSRSSLREAIRVLEHAGVLDVRSGSGTYVSEGGVSNAALLRARAAVVGEHSPLDVVAARRALEPVCAELAAVYRHAHDIDLLRENIDEHAEMNARGDDPEEVDLSFHLGVAAATQNPVLTTLIEHVVEIMGQGTWRDLKHRSRERAGIAESYLEQHRDILLAIERSDPQGAGSAMLRHLDAIEAGLLAEVR